MFEKKCIGSDSQGRQFPKYLLPFTLRSPKGCIIFCRELFYIYKDFVSKENKHFMNIENYLKEMKHILINNKEFKAKETDKELVLLKTVKQVITLCHKQHIIFKLEFFNVDEYKNTILVLFPDILKNTEDAIQHLKNEFRIVGKTEEIIREQMNNFYEKNLEFQAG